MLADSCPHSTWHPNPPTPLHLPLMGPTDFNNSNKTHTCTNTSMCVFYRPSNAQVSSAEQSSFCSHLLRRSSVTAPRRSRSLVSIQRKSSGHLELEHQAFPAALAFSLVWLVQPQSDTHRAIFHELVSGYSQEPKEVF